MRFDKFINSVLKEELSREDRIKALKDLGNQYHVDILVEIQGSSEGRFGDEHEYRTYEYGGIVNFEEGVVYGQTVFEAFKYNTPKFIDSLNEYLADENEDSVKELDPYGEVYYNNTEDTYVFVAGVITQKIYDFADEHFGGEINTDSNLYVMLRAKPGPEISKLNFITIMRALKNKKNYQLNQI